MTKKYSKEPVVINGVEYKTMADACRTYHKLQSCVLQRLQRGMPLEKAMTDPTENRNDIYHGGKEITVNGTIFPSLRAAVRYYHLNYATVSNRLQSPHWTIEEAFELTEHKQVITHTGSAKPITVEDKTYASIDDACKAYNVERAKVYTRRKRGWTIEESLGIKPRDTSKYAYSNCGRRHSKPITIDGIEYQSIEQAAQHFKVKYQTLYWRLKNKIPINEALKK
jgi:hypothetical protein